MRSSSPRFYDPVRSFFNKISMGHDRWEWRGMGHINSDRVRQG